MPGAPGGPARDAEPGEDLDLEVAVEALPAGMRATPAATLRPSEAQRGWEVQRPAAEPHLDVLSLDPGSNSEFIDAPELDFAVPRWTCRAGAGHPCGP